IAPACGSCNASKCNDEVTGWLRRKRLDERVFLLRHLEINAMLALQFGGSHASNPASPGTSITCSTPAPIRKTQLPQP
ncbi:MAG TPA: hypothetical protein VJ617_06060, partial [Arthrobacter sp.]|nr:hypothetical protein [Arthrobacter sp.]